MMPGEIEERTKAQRLRDGIDIDDNDLVADRGRGPESRPDRR